PTRRRARSRTRPSRRWRAPRPSARGGMAASPPPSGPARRPPPQTPAPPGPPPPRRAARPAPPRSPPSPTLPPRPPPRPPSPRAAFTGARILRTVEPRTRRFLADGTAAGLDLAPAPAWQLVVRGAAESPAERTLHGYDRLADGARLRARVRFPSASVEVEET